MYVSFETLPSSSKVWVYQGERTLSKEEMEKAEQLCLLFVDQWTAHNKELQASFLWMENRFLILSVNEEIHGASGCSIDASVRFVQELGRRLSNNFLDRKVVFIIQNEMQNLTLPEIKKSVMEGVISTKTVYFNNLVNTKQSFETEWKTTVTNGWMNRYFKKEGINN